VDHGPRSGLRWTLYPPSQANRIPQRSFSICNLSTSPSFYLSICSIGSMHHPAAGVWAGLAVGPASLASSRSSGPLGAGRIWTGVVPVHVGEQGVWQDASHVRPCTLIQTGRWGEDDQPHRCSGERWLIGYRSPIMGYRWEPAPVNGRWCALARVFLFTP